jgi:hypothetical protein
MLAEKSGKQTFPTSLPLRGERKFVIARTFDGPARIVSTRGSAPNLGPRRLEDETARIERYRQRDDARLRRVWT